MATKVARVRRHSISSLEEAKLAVENDVLGPRKRPLEGPDMVQIPAKRPAPLLDCTAASEDPQCIAGGISHNNLYLVNHEEMYFSLCMKLAVCSPL